MLPLPPPVKPAARRRRAAGGLLPLIAATALVALPSTAHAIERGTIDVSVDGGGRVTGTQIDCPGSCSGTFFWPDDTVPPRQRLTAIPAPGWALDTWSGCFLVVNRPLECDAMPDEHGAAVLARFVDVEDPTVAWMSPPDHSVVMPGVRFAVHAPGDDNDEVRRVEYRLDGQVAGEATSAPWGTTVEVPPTFPDGIHQLTAQAFDRSGRRSAIRTLTLVSDGTPPTIEFSGPALVRTQAASYGVALTVTDEHLTQTTCTVTAPTGAQETLGSCPSGGTVSLAMSSLGPWKLTVAAVDRASNRAEREITVIREAAPDPAPDPEPGPEPDPSPGPGPGPQPAPRPDPGPGPTPGPGPHPAPGPLPGPAPVPGPGPLPAPPGGPDTTGRGTPRAPTSSAKRCVVPTVRRGTALKTAKKRLTRANCRVRTARARSKTVRSGRVIRISQKPGRRLPKGTRITVTVARR